MDKKKLIEVIEAELDEVAGMMKESDSYDARSSLHALENIYEDLAKMNYNEKELDLFRRCIDSLDKFVSDAEQEENDAYDAHFRENKEPICEDCPDLEEAFVIDDEGGPMRKPQQQQQEVTMGQTPIKVGDKVKLDPRYYGQDGSKKQGIGVLRSISSAGRYEVQWPSGEPGPLVDRDAGLVSAEAESLEEKSGEKCRVCGTKLAPGDTGYCKDCEKDAKKDYDKEQAASSLEEEVLRTIKKLVSERRNEKK